MMWEKKSLGVIADVYNGNSINADYKKKHFLGLADGLPFVATKDVLSNGEIDYNNGVRVPQDAGLKIAPADSVFVCAEGGSAGKKIAYVKEDVCFGNKLFCILPKNKELYSAKYIYYYCRSEYFRAQFFSELAGLIGGVSAKKFRNIECIFPPFPEQERIVSLLDAEFAKIDAIKANAEKQYGDTMALYKSALKDLLTPADDWKDSIINDVIDHGSNISYGIVQPGDNLTEGVPVVRPVDLILNETLTSTKHFKKTSESISQAYSRTILNGKEILMCVRGTTGVVSLSSTVLKGCNVTRGIVPFKISDDILRKFIFYTFQAPITFDFIQQYTQGAALKQINIKDVKNIPISLPPSKSDIENIVNRLDAISHLCYKLKSNYFTTITLCNDLKQSILKDIFG